MKKERLLYPLFRPKEIFLIFVFYLNIYLYIVLNTIS